MIIRCRTCGKTYEVKETELQAISCLACHSRFAVRIPKKLIAQDTDGYKKLFDSPEWMTSKYSGIGLIPKVMSLMLVISLLPLILFAVISIRQNSQQLRKDTELIGSQLTLRLAKQVDEWVQKYVSAIEALAHMPDIQSMNPRKQQPLLEAVKENNQGMVAVFTSGLSGRLIAANTDSAIPAYSELLDRYTFFRLVSGQQKVMWRTMVNKVSQEHVLITAVPIKKDGRVIGIVANAVSLGYISRLVALWKRGTTGNAFIIDKDGTMLAHQSNKYTLQKKDMRDHPLIHAFLNGLFCGTMYFKDLYGNTYLGHIRGTRNGWALVLEQSDQEAFALLYQNRKFAIILLSLTIVVVLGIAWFAGRSIVNPIKKLSNAADRISMGDLDLKIDIKSKDEIGQLGKSIERMQKSIFMAINRLRHKPGRDLQQSTI